MSKLLVDCDTPRVAGESQFETEVWLDTAPFESLLGLEVEEAKGGRAVLSMPFGVKLARGGGVLHGGASVTDEEGREVPLFTSVFRVARTQEVGL